MLRLAASLLFGTALLACPATATPQQGADARPADTERVRYLGVPSALLSDFLGRETVIEAGVVQPADFRRGERIPVVYHVHGFGGSYRSAWGRRQDVQEGMDSGRYPRMLHVYLDARCPLGHHVFADSVNTGPWATALVEEFIPALEQEYGVLGGAQGRFLTGHSSGGWSTLWLQVAHPDIFNGTWPTAPDPVDFRDFTGVDIYSWDNAYVDPAGEEIPLMRRDGEWVRTIREFVARELEQQGEYGGQFASFDAVFGPRGEDGRPKPLFDWESGAIDPEVARYWERYDIKLVLERRWESLGPKLAGKLHVYCGTADTFRLEGAVLLLQEALAELGSDAQFHLAEGRTHGDLYGPQEEMWPDGLATRIYSEMQARFEATAPSAAAQRPNVLFILADDLGYGDLGAMNAHSRIPTPSLDALAAEGMRFTDAHSPAAVCTPTRYGLLTGRYPWRSRIEAGVLWGDDRLLIEPDRRTLPQMLQEAGYSTAVIGKWHLGLGAYDPEQPDLRTDFAAVDAGPHTVGFADSLVLPASLDIPPYVLLRDGAVEAEPTERVPENDRWWFGGTGFWRAGLAAPGFVHEQLLPRLGEEAVSYLDGRAAAEDDQPFFLFLSLTSPHTPWLPLEEWRGASQAGPYGDFVAQTDAMLGEVFAALERNGLAEDTLVVFTSDNGAHWRTQDVRQFGHHANGPWRGQKADIEEGGHRVPMLVRWPGLVAANSSSDALVSLQDWYATFAELLQQPLAAGEAPDSVSMLGQLRPSPGEAGRADLVHQSYEGTLALRSGRWKLIQGLGSGGFTEPSRVLPAPGQDGWRLYDLRTDPGEREDLSEVRPEIVERLRARLDAIRAAQR